MKALKLIFGLLTILVTLPISLYLQYKILGLVHATDVMWLLFWANVPLIVLFSVISKIAESSDRD